MAPHFEREKHLVALLMQRLGRTECHYHDPNAPGHESGVDVLAMSNGCRIGIQVTEVDTGLIKGVARGEEKKLWRISNPGAYAVWAQNDSRIILESIRGAISRKVAIANAHTFDQFDDVWLLVSAGIPEMGSIASTLIISLGLHAGALDMATLDLLSRSKKYKRAYLHCILDVERALYSWRRGGRWEKQIQQDLGDMGLTFWDFQKLTRNR